MFFKVISACIQGNNSCIDGPNFEWFILALSITLNNLCNFVEFPWKFSTPVSGILLVHHDFIIQNLLVLLLYFRRIRFCELWIFMSNFLKLVKIPVYLSILSCVNFCVLLWFRLSCRAFWIFHFHLLSKIKSFACASIKYNI